MEPGKKLNVLWTTDNRDTFLHMIAMYTHNSKRQSWFENVNIIIWGPSSRLVSEDKEIQIKIMQMQEDGVSFQACRACADIYGVASKLENFGVEVKYIGTEMTEILKSENSAFMSI